MDRVECDQWFGFLKYGIDFGFKLNEIARDSFEEDLNCKYKENEEFI